MNILEKKLTIVGGDLRNVKLAEMLAQDGYEISAYGFETVDSLKQYSNIRQFEKIEDAIYQNNVIIGPTPLSINSKEVNMLFSNEKVEIEKFLKYINQSKILIAGSIRDNQIKIIEENNGKAIDLLKREELSILNAISTVEGTIGIAIRETSRTLHNSNVLIMGFGRIGKILAKRLEGLGANVYCEARKNADLAWVRAFGYNPIHLDNIDEYLDKFDIIINTIPFVVLNETRLEKIQKHCFIIDLASNPGGLDREAAKKKNIKFVWALSLPGKTAPITSAEYIKETLYNILKEL